MSQEDLRNAIVQLTNLVAKQQQQIENLANRTFSTAASGSEKTIESLANGIQDFLYDPDAGVFFDAWYARYEDVFIQDGHSLDDAARVRLLLRKLSTPLHDKYVNTILPKHPRDFSLDETVTKLKKLFGRQKSLPARYQCLQYAKSDADDFTSYAAMVNKHCEAFQLSKLTSDQFKALRFVCGLQSPRDADIRARLISKLKADESAVVEQGEAASKVTLDNLVEECHRVANLKHDSQMVENKEACSVNAISRNQNHSCSKKTNKVPKTPCWKCGELHYVRECPFASHMCTRCKQQGHKEGYCSSSKPAASKPFKQWKPKESMKTNGIYTVRNVGRKRKFVSVELNGVAVKLQHDSASDITIISNETWASIGRPPTQPTDESAVTASGSDLNLLAEFQADITINNVTKTGRIFISDSADLNVLGIDTMDLFDLWSVPINSLVNVVHQNSDQYVDRLKHQFPEIGFLGLIVDKDGVRPDPSKTEAIAKMPPPKDVKQLRSYLGAINYYRMKHLRAPLDDLLKKDARWNWTKECQKSFEQFKTILLSDLLLTHYDPSKEIIVAADASKYGLGAVVMHRFPTGEVKAIAHASRSLTAAEMNYGQVEKEALALIFAVTRFHKMLYGRHFTLETDHQPLLKVFGSKKGIPVYTANRLQRWALTLLLYDFEIKHISTMNFGYADFLSRLMSSQRRPDEDYVIAAVYVESEAKAILEDSINNLPVTHQMIVAETRKDAVLQQVISYINEGWPASVKLITDPDVKKFFVRREGLQVVDNCVMFGDRIVVPSKFRKRIVRQLHRGHPGMERMKSLARSYIYWPNVDDDVAQFVRQCDACAEAAKAPTKATLESWPLPDRPWQRVHVDFAGPIDGHHYFVIIHHHDNNFGPAS
ncbi:uncharacterized protein LOC133391707 [Anopheles gambiae]|uniref:uncharacterized protein LOC133391707 n=1 Tax=Anopheles gambiae TaxID=7165 RepID=UPI002AC9B424|nr:uncharacterized protein LOC133391707 [Anopheles gambiae]